MKKIMLLIGIAVAIFTGCSSDEEESGYQLYVSTHIPESYGMANVKLTGEFKIIEGNPHIQTAGFCWAELSSDFPTVEDEHMEAYINGGTFSLTLSEKSVDVDVIYLVRAYVKIGDDIIYDTQCKAFQPAIPTEYFPKWGELTLTSGGINQELGFAYANVNCRLEYFHNDYYLAMCGIIFSTSPEPTLLDSQVMGELGRDDVLRVKIPMLAPSTTYYIRAWGLTSLGLFYSNELVYTTPDSSSPANSQN